MLYYNNYLIKKGEIQCTSPNLNYQNLVSIGVGAGSALTKSIQKYVFYSKVH